MFYHSLHGLHHGFIRVDMVYTGLWHHRGCEVLLLRGASIRFHKDFLRRSVYSSLTYPKGSRLVGLGY